MGIGESIYFFMVCWFQLCSRTWPSAAVPPWCSVLMCGETHVRNQCSFYFMPIAFSYLPHASKQARITQIYTTVEIAFIRWGKLMAFSLWQFPVMVAGHLITPILFFFFFLWSLVVDLPTCCVPLPVLWLCVHVSDFHCYNNQVNGPVLLSPNFFKSKSSGWVGFL